MITMKMMITGKTENAVETETIRVLGILCTKDWKVVSVSKSRRKFPTYWLKTARVVKEEEIL